MGYKSIGGSIYPEHKRSVSLPQIPGSADYKPIPVSYNTFEGKNKEAKARKYKKKGTFGSKNLQRSSSLGPGPKYNLISQWVEIKTKHGAKKGKNMFKSLSSLKQPGVYH